VLENIFILNLQHALRQLLPLFVIPLAANVATSEDFGNYMFAIAAAIWLSTILEYGFGISSTRAVAQGKNINELRQVVSATQSAKLLLVLFSSVAALALWITVSAIALHWTWAITAWMLGVLNALQPNYYFLGKERLRFVGFVELCAAAATFLLVLLLVRAPENFLRLPVILVSMRAVSVAILTTAMWRDVSLSWADMGRFKSGWRALRSGFQVFIFQAAISLYTTFNVIFLSLLVPIDQIGPYAAAERLMRAGLGFFAQISIALFSRMNVLRDSDLGTMKRSRTKSLLYMIWLGLLGGVIAFSIGPLLAHWLLGENAGQVGVIIKTMAWVVPAIALSSTLGFQYLLVNHLERDFNRIILVAVVVSLPLSYLLITFLGSAGMAISWVVVEWLIAIALVVYVRYSKKMDKKF
jgi:PST family polysaccharide transporter